MLKKLLLPAFLLACLIPAYAQHQRRVLIEEFTNASCPPCAAQNPTFNATIEANYDYLTPIKYQTVWPGVDPMNAQNPTEVANRVTYYGVTGVPNGRQNGTLEVFPMTSYTADMINAAYNTLTPVTMSLTHELTANYDSIVIHLSVTSDDALTGNLHLRTAVTEKAIYFDAAPGTNGETEFFNVMRKMLPGADGTLTGDFAAGETKTYDFVWPLAYIYDLNRLNVLAWLQDDATKEVYQSAITEPLNNVPSVGIRVPSDNLVTCTLGVAPSFTLTNTAATPLTTAQLQYRVGSDAWKDLNWTGNLLPGASQVVTLTDYSITQSTNTKVQVIVIGSNNGIQTNLVGSTSSITIRSLFSAASPTPFSNDFQNAVFPPTGWTVFNPNTNGWKLATGYGAGGSTRSARVNFYSIAPGLNSVLITPKLDLTTANGPTHLTFDHAYGYYSAAYPDSLRIEVSTDCGDNWTTIFHDGYLGLATAGPVTASQYLPAAGEWNANDLDITAFNGNEVLIRFVGESGYGNNLYIDNVNVSTITGVKELPLTEFSLQPNPTRGTSQVRFSLVNPSSVRMLVFNSIGALVESRELGELVSGDHSIVLDAARLGNGSYQVVLQGNEGVAHTQWVVIK